MISWFYPIFKIGKDEFIFATSNHVCAIAVTAQRIANDITPSLELDDITFVEVRELTRKDICDVEHTIRVGHVKKHVRFVAGPRYNFFTRLMNTN